MRPLGYPSVTSPVWYNTENYLLILSLNSSEHIGDSLSKLITEGAISKGRHGDYVFHWQGIGNARKKCLVVSISLPQLHWVLHSL